MNKSYYFATGNLKGFYKQSEQDDNHCISCDSETDETSSFLVQKNRGTNWESFDHQHGKYLKGSKKYKTKKQPYSYIAVPAIYLSKSFLQICIVMKTLQKTLRLEYSSVKALSVSEGFYKATMDQTP